MVDVWNCPSCGVAQGAAFCPQCGEEVLHAHDLTLKDVALQAGKSLTSLDGKVFRSFRTLLTRPGRLTFDFLRGARRGSLGPAQIFFSANALFFAVQSLVGTNIFSAPLASHLYAQDWSGFAQDWVGARLAARHQTLAAYAPLFDAAVDFNAKLLVILMAAAFAPLSALAFHSAHRPIGAHVVFALHVYAFILVLFCFSLAVVEVDLLLGGPGLKGQHLDAQLSLFNLFACGLYLTFACRRAFGARGAAGLAKALALTAAAAAITIGYRFALFVLTVLTV